MPDKARGGPQEKAWILLALLSGAWVYLYVNLFAWPNVPYLLSGDQVFSWTDAQRMLHGERIYQDFFRFTPPGTDLIYLAAFRILGPYLWVTNVIVLLLGMAVCGVCFSLASQLMDRAWAALASLLFLVLIYGPLLNATHHWFSLLGVMLATRVLMPQRTIRRIATAGALLGVASFFTQTAGVMCLFALLVFLAVESRYTGRPWRRLMEHQLLLVSVFALTVGVLNVYYIAKVGWRPLWDMQVSYPRHLTYWFERYFPGLPDVLTVEKLPRLAPSLAIYALLPVIYPLVLWHCRRGVGNAGPRKRAALALLSLTGLALLLEIIPAVNWLRVYAVSMPAVILLVWVASRLDRLRKIAAVAGCFLIAILAFQQTWSKHRPDNRVVELPSGRVALPAQKADHYLWIMNNTRPGDYFFAAPWPGVYLPLGLRSPVSIDILLTNDWTPKEYVDLAVHQLDGRQVKYILWSTRLNTPEDPSRPWEDHLGPIRAYLTNRYKRVHIFFDGEEIWQHN
jgi:hypothetical protein